MKNEIFKFVSSNKNQMFISSAGRVNTNSRPTLVIGLGGTGAEAVLRVKKRVFDKFKLNEKNGERPDNVEYLVIDTDIASEKIKFEGVGLEKKYGEFLLIRNADLVHIIEKIRNENNLTTSCKNNKLYKDIKKWLSDDIPVSRIVNGAAGIRQAGRLILYLNMVKVKNAICDKLKTIACGKSLSEVELDIYLMFGIGGGTGSGIFLDVSYLVRRLIYDMGGNPNINGMVFLPDVTLSKRGIDLITKNNVYLNGYAALLELDYFMEIDKRIKDGQAENVNHEYGNIIETEWNKNIFERCFLLGASDETRRLSFPPAEMALNTAADAICTIIEDDKSGFNVNSFFSNTIPHVDDLNNICEDEYCYKSKKYTIIGSSSYVFPYNELTTYLLCKLAKSIDFSTPKISVFGLDIIGLTTEKFRKIIRGKLELNFEQVSAPNPLPEKAGDKLLLYCELFFDKNNKIFKNLYEEVGPVGLVKTLNNIIIECDNNISITKIKGLNANEISIYKQCLAVAKHGAEHLKDKLEQKDVKVVNSFTETFKGFDYIKFDNKTQTDDINRQIVFRLALPKDIIEIAEKYLNTCENFFDEITKKLYSELYSHINFWYRNDGVNPYNYISDFIQNVFKDIINETFDSFIENNRTLIKEKAETLYEHSYLQFPFSSLYNSVESGEVLCTFVKVPEKLDKVFQETSLKQKQNITYTTSDCETYISQNTFQVNISLDDYFLFEKLQKYSENKYKGALSSKMEEKHFRKGFNVKYGKATKQTEQLE